ncbi:transthyretin [Lentinula edodes]|uniref:transthyretin n=1 Tax=Lentinula edodes TaxID=5353 RepID=UPI001E8DCB0E|nr:transthyretin [Lentinula edodes]KAH7880952.1 transthyretin [Lentinula edodes]
MKSPITCHVLDTSTGRPAQGVIIKLQQYEETEGDAFLFTPIAKGETDFDGRCTDLLPPITSTETKDLLKPGLYKMIFRTKEYFDSQCVKTFYPWVEITFELSNLSEHYHIPLLISPYGFTTYRGS